MSGSRVSSERTSRAGPWRSGEGGEARESCGETSIGTGALQGLIRSCLRGDPGAWESLIRRSGALIYSVPWQAGLGEKDASSVFQEVCRELWRSLPELRDHPKPRAWLITTAARHTWRRVRSRGRPGGPVCVGQHIDAPAAKATLVARDLTPVRVA